MKKIAFFIAIAFSLFATSTRLHAQAAAATTKGDVLVDVGVGFIVDNYNGNNPTGDLGWNYSNNNSNSNYTLPTFSVVVQKAFWNDITIGGQVAFNIAGSKHDLNEAGGYYEYSKSTQTNLYILGRGEYHFNRLIKWPPKVDLYAGALIGGRISTASTTEQRNGQIGVYEKDYPNQHSTSGAPAGGVFGGVRYYFKGNMSVYAEVGVGVTVFRTGLAWRL